MRKVFIFIGLVLLVILVGYADALTGRVPDFTIAYLIPIVLAAILLGLRSGIAIVALAALVEVGSDTILGLGLEITRVVDGVFHLSVFLAALILVDKLITQLSIVRRLEERRSHDIRLGLSPLFSVN